MRPRPNSIPNAAAGAVQNPASGAPKRARASLGWAVFPRDASSGGTAAPLFLLAAGLVLGLAVHTQANLLFWLFGLGVGAAVFAAAHGWLAFRGLRVERLPLGRAVAGEPLALGYEIRNAGRIACLSLRVRELDAHARDDVTPALPWVWWPRVGPGRSARLSGIAEAPSRGEHALSAVEVSTTFPLGLFRRRKVVHQPDTLRVLPALVTLSPAVVRAAARPRPGPGGQATGNRVGAEGDFYASRSYRVGDPLRTLDWKRSASVGELMVRELAVAEPSRVAVYLDLNVAGDDPGDLRRIWQERAISVAASLITRGHAMGFRVGLHVEGVACPAFTPHHALAHRDRLLGALCRIDLSAPVPPTPEAARSRAMLEATVRVSATAPGPAAAPEPRGEENRWRPEALIHPAVSPAARSAGRLATAEVSP